MRDIFLSYSHRDGADASALYDELDGHGMTVWMDNPTRLRAEEAAASRETGVPSTSDPVAAIGLLPGLPHWQYIRRAIDESAAFVVLNTPDWHDSEYCAKELGYAREAGKRVAVIGRPDQPPFPEGPGGIVRCGRDDVAGLVTVLRRRADIAYAHARLSQRQDAASPSVSRLDRLLRSLRHDDLEHDAETVLAAVPGPDVPVLSARVHDRAEAVAAAARSRRKTLRSAAATVTAVLATLFVTTAAAGLAARQDEQRARASAARARSLDLADRALSAEDSVEAQRLAADALAADSNAESRSAAAIITGGTLAYLRRSFPERQWGTAAASADGSRLAFGYGTGVVVTDRQGTMLKDLTLSPAPRGHRLVFGARDRLYGAAESAGGGALMEYDVATGRSRPALARPVSAVASDAARVWWATPDGEVGYVGAPGEGAVAVLPRGSAGDGTVTGLEAHDGDLTLITDDRTVTRYDVHVGPSPALLWRIDLDQMTAPPAVISGPDAVDPENATQTWPAGTARYLPSLQDRILTCDGITHIDILVNTGRGRLGFDIHVALDASGRLLTAFSRSGHATTTACGPRPGTAMGTGLFARELRPLPDPAWVPVALVPPDNPLNMSVVVSGPPGVTAVAAQSGGLRISGAAPILTRTVGAAITLAPVEGGNAVVHMIDGNVYLVPRDGPARQTGRIDEPLEAGAETGRTASLLRSGRAVYLVDGSGRVRRHALPPSVPARIRDARWARDERVIVLVTDDDQVRLLHPDTGVVDAPAPLPRLAPHEAVVEAGADDGVVYAGTDAGRVLAVELRTGQTNATVIGPAGPVHLDVARRGRHGIVVAPADGTVRAVDAALKVTAVHQLGTPGELVRTSPLTGQVLVLVSGAEPQGWLMAGSSLEVERLVPNPQGTTTRTIDPAWRFSPDREELVVFSSYQRFHNGASNMRELQRQTLDGARLADAAKDVRITDAFGQLTVAPLCARRVGA